MVQHFISPLLSLVHTAYLHLLTRQEHHVYNFVLADWYNDSLILPLSWEWISNREASWQSRGCFYDTYSSVGCCSCNWCLYRGWTSAIPVKIKEYAKKFPLQDRNTKQFIAWVVPNELLFPYGEWNAICNRSCGEWWCGCSKQPSVYFLNSKSFKCFHLMAETTRWAWI